MGRGARRFIDDLLAGRRPRSFAASAKDAEEIRTALTLRAAAPRAAEPRPDFVADLHRRLAAAAAADAEASRSPESGPQALPGSGAQPPSAGAGRRAGNSWPGGTRRGFVWVTSVAAGATAVGAAVGAGADRLFSRGGGGAETTAADHVIVPNTATWWTVATSQDLPEGSVRAFDLGAVTGFVERRGGEVRAVSGVCTHQGCQLALDAAVRRLNCPCHRTVFELTGEVAHSQLKTPPRTLPEFEVREVSGVVQVFAPPGSERT
ncbi:Rieske (2Fe-2S) protein [Frankia sp. AgB32]|uniref:Rieske (2Fe-2S) protein n=1 Tax=Frankia sp. AgB32 TaxID=631119 RepID=UPI00200C3398|nr:Rieske (2Fe-2S) protein [Frankia sp. AgB32]MCK9897322.1 Rieske (2Fe-2S) protein [Frankia sp. AgB32]